MVAWAVTAIRERYPAANITWATETMCMPVIDCQRLVNDVFEFRRQAWKQSPKSADSYRDQWRTYRKLRERTFDIAIDFQGHLKTAMAVRMARANRKISTRGTDALSRLLVPQFSGTMPDHEVDRALSIAQGVIPEIKMPARVILPNSVHLVSPIPYLVTINTGASRAEKLVDVRVWQAVGNQLAAEGYHVVAIGGSADAGLEGRIENRVGQTTLAETLGWLQRSQLHLCGDTGTGHLAAGYGVPTGAVFTTDKNPPERYSPRGDHVEVIRAFETEANPELILGAARRLLGSQ